MPYICGRFVVRMVQKLNILSRSMLQAIHQQQYDLECTNDGGGAVASIVEF